MNSSIFVGCTPQSLNLGQFTLGAIVASVPWTATKAGPSQKLRVHFFPLFDFLQLKILHAPSFSTFVGAWKNQARRMRKSGWNFFFFEKPFCQKNALKLRIHVFPLFQFLQLKILHAPSFSTVVSAWKNQARRMRKSGWKKHLFQKAFLPENVQLSSWQNST